MATGAEPPRPKITIFRAFISSCAAAASVSGSSMSRVNCKASTALWNTLSRTACTESSALISSWMISSGETVACARVSFKSS